MVVWNKWCTAHRALHNSMEEPELPEDYIKLVILKIIEEREQV